MPESRKKDWLPSLSDSPSAAGEPAPLDIAIIGLSGRYPQSNDVVELWKNLCESKDCITEVPKERWDWRSFYTQDRTQPSGHYSKWGGFVDDIDKFDPLFFNISPLEASYLDPQERLFLEHAWAAVEDAGYSLKKLHDITGKLVSVYAGAMYGHYQLFGAEASLRGVPNVAASSFASIANRVSYVMDLHGPSMAVDTMSSSSLTALHMACQDLKSGNAHLAIAGGVNVTIHPVKYHMLSVGQFISSHGHCASFGKGGKGYVPAEGVGVVILKRLADAEVDGDQIYGVIKGSAVNHGGKTSGYTVPNPKAQQFVIVKALKESGVVPESVSYIEAHGTGTKLGDPIEIKGLSEAYHRQSLTEKKQLPIWIGSIKSNIGHCESAAGIAGVTKILLQLRHKKIVPSLHSQELNPDIDFNKTPFDVNQQLREWKQTVIDGKTYPRVAGVSSFGAGGANAHMLIEEYAPLSSAQPAVQSNKPVDTSDRYIIVLSAKCRSRLHEYVKSLLRFIQTGDASINLRDLAFTLQVGRQAMSERLGVIVSSVEQLEQKLNKVLQAYAQPDVKIEGFCLTATSNNQNASGSPKSKVDVDTLLAREAYDEFLGLWLKGHSIEWEVLYGNPMPRRISAPTYPFARERYWLDANSPKTVSLVEAGLREYSGSENSPETEAPEDNKDATAELENSEGLDDTIVKIQDILIQLVHQLLRLPIKDINITTPFSDYGFSSVSYQSFINELNSAYGLRLNPTVFFDFPTITELSLHLQQDHKALIAGLSQNKQTSVSVEEVKKPIGSSLGTPEPIAIVGMSGKFPMAENLDEFWHNIHSGKDCIQAVPKRRWDWYGLDHEPLAHQSTANIKWGGFIEGIDEFDPGFFGISVAEAESMDPQQRLLMTHIWWAMEDAGYPAESLSGTATGIFVGTTNSGYGSLVSKSSADIEHYSAASNAPSMGPNRMSYMLNIHGPSEPIDTACSSSLVAIHRARIMIESGSCDQAFVGGVNTLITPDTYISFNKAGMLSDDGRCKTFSKAANGYVRAEGIGMLFVKKLEAAEKAGDTIYGVIRGSAENHGGRAAALTAPNPKAQSEMLVQAYQKASIDPGTVSYIEVHGTGTTLGDAIEINALKAAFKKLHQKTQNVHSNKAYCGLGSVKTNIGHTEFAAGIAGVIKVLLQFKHSELVKNIHCDELNPYIDLQDTPFYLLDESRPWEALIDADGAMLPRRAGVSSFSFGGVNAHVILEEYCPNDSCKTKAANTGRRDDISVPVILPISAKNKEQLREYASSLLLFLNRAGDEKELVNLQDLAYTFQVGRDAMPERLGLIVYSAEELKEKLQIFVERSSDSIEYVEGIYIGHAEYNKIYVLDEQVTRGKLSASDCKNILTHWVKGFSFDWNSLYDVESPRRIRAPKYPFSKASYWIDVASKENSSQARPLKISSEAAGDCAGSPDSHSADLTLEKKAEWFIQQLIAEHLKKPINEIPMDLEFYNMGLASIGLTRIAQSIRTAISPEFQPTVLFENTRIPDLSNYLAKNYPDSVKGLNLDMAITKQDSTEKVRQPTPSDRRIPVFSQAVAKRDNSSYEKIHPKSSASSIKSVPAKYSSNSLIIPPEFPELIHLNNVSKGRPVFWFHGGLGGVQSYHGFADKCQRPFLGIQARGYQTERDPLYGVSAMAAYYVYIIQTVQPEGPYDLGGMSLGGLISYEVARQLQELGHSVNTITMIDTFGPVDFGESELPEAIPPKNGMLQAANMILGPLVSLNPNKLEEIFIHRDELIDCEDDEVFLARLISLLKERGLRDTEGNFHKMIMQQVNVQQAYDFKNNGVSPLPRPEEINCYYFRNSSGLFWGRLEPYNVFEKPFSLDHINYWSEFERHLPNFNMMDLNSSSHIEMLMEPKIYETLGEFCKNLYSSGTPKSITKPFKFNTDRIPT